MSAYHTAASPDGARALNGALIKALKTLHAMGEGELACRMAAEAWAAIRRSNPPEAERLTGVLHFLVREPKKEKNHD